MAAAHLLAPSIPKATRRPGCTGKSAFVCRAEAVKHVSVNRLHPYRCPWCAHWHLSSLNKAAPSTKVALRAARAQKE